MNLPKSHSDQDDLHGHTVELLPWYVNGTLEPSELTQVELHLAACAACRNELQRWRTVDAAVQSDANNTPWQLSEGHVSRIMGRLDTTELRSSPAPGWRSWIGRWPDWLQASPPVARWVMAAQAAALAVGVSLLWTAPAPNYQTYSTETRSAAVAGDRSLLRMVFSPETTLAQAQEALASVGASMVEGPSPRGVYTIALAGAALAPEQLDSLRAMPGIMLAEPIR